jgi:hypothetical protein
MLARILVVLDDLAFADDLATVLRLDGHEVVVFASLTLARKAQRVAGKLEIQITQVDASPPGIRIVATLIPDPAAYTGGWGTFVAEPLSVEDVAAALRRMLPPGPP